jgi:hypothetical protein
LWFSPDTLISSTNKTDPQDITEILLKMVLSMRIEDYRKKIPDAENYTKLALEHAEKLLDQAELLEK